MTAFLLHPQHNVLRRYAPGLILSLLVAAIALWTGNNPRISAAGLSALTLAILLGMVPGNTLYPRLDERCNVGGYLCQTASAAPRHYSLRLSPDIFANC